MSISARGSEFHNNDTVPHLDGLDRNELTTNDQPHLAVVLENNANLTLVF